MINSTNSTTVLICTPTPCTSAFVDHQSRGATSSDRLGFQPEKTKKDMRKPRGGDRCCRRSWNPANRTCVDHWLQKHTDLTQRRQGAEETKPFFCICKQRKNVRGTLRSEATKRVPGLGRAYARCLKQPDCRCGMKGRNLSAICLVVRC